MFLKLGVRAKRRLFIIIAILGFCAGLLFIFLGAMHESIVYYKTTSELLEMKNFSKKLRLGGLVLRGSVSTINNQYFFKVTDTKTELDVAYLGRFPDLFREGQGVVLLGKFDEHNKIFIAEKVMVKHDQNYKPPKIA